MIVMLSVSVILTRCFSLKLLPLQNSESQTVPGLPYACTLPGCQQQHLWTYDINHVKVVPFLLLLVYFSAAGTTWASWLYSCMRLYLVLSFLCLLFLSYTSSFACKLSPHETTETTPQESSVPSIPGKLVKFCSH